MTKSKVKSAKEKSTSNLKGNKPIKKSKSAVKPSGLSALSDVSAYETDLSLG
jgi:hypothetical protein